jgi:hypothetical protein
MIFSFLSMVTRSLAGVTPSPTGSWEKGREKTFRNLSETKRAAAERLVDVAAFAPKGNLQWASLFRMHSGRWSRTVSG